MTTFPITFFLFLSSILLVLRLSLSIQFIHLSPVNKVGKREGELEAKISPLFAKAVAKTKLQKGQREGAY